MLSTSCRLAITIISKSDTIIFTSNGDNLFRYSGCLTYSCSNISIVYFIYRAFSICLLQNLLSQLMHVECFCFACFFLIFYTSQSTAFMCCFFVACLELLLSSFSFQVMFINGDSQLVFLFYSSRSGSEASALAFRKPFLK